MELDVIKRRVVCLLAFLGAPYEGIVLEKARLVVDATRWAIPRHFVFVW